MVAGAAAVGFKWLIDLTIFAAYWGKTTDLLEAASTAVWWHMLLVPALGGLLIGWFVHRFALERRVQGVPDVITASIRDAGKLPPRALLPAALASAASAGVGASVGREGPMVHLGASLGSWIAQRLKLTPYDTRTLLACGVASGVAASFNVPVGGAVFAFEICLRRYSIQRLAPVAIAAVTGTALNRYAFGDFPAWRVEEQILISNWEFPAFALLGAICALLGLAVIRLTALVKAAHARLSIHPILRPALAGLALGAIALIFPQVLGIGYEATSEALRGAYPLGLLAMLLVAKVAATALSLGSGFGGGVFSPSLVIGAFAGGVFGGLATLAFPEYSSGPTAYMVVAMAATAGALLGTPFAKVIIIFEMVNSYPVALGVLVATVISSIILNDVWRTNFFRAGVEALGLRPGAISMRAALVDMAVQDLVRPIPEGASVRASEPALSVEETGEAAWDLMKAHEGDRVMVHEPDDPAAIIGMIEMSDLLSAYRRVMAQNA
ncbi:MAG: chloride channel protein [Alphaproteobacteria bacterium]|nr:chloride channel protein [Alphaproteobacteria bacterium]